MKAFGVGGLVLFGIVFGLWFFDYVTIQNGAKVWQGCALAVPIAIFAGMIVAADDARR